MKKLLYLLSVGILLTASNVSAENVSEKVIQNDLKHSARAIFPIGVSNTANAKYFTGDSFVANLSVDGGIPIFNVTFYRGAHTFWHIHHGTCQILAGVAGEGYYQIWGESAKKLQPGETVTIPEGVKHWHGAAPGKTFQHIAIMQPVENASTEWLEPVSNTEYNQLK